MKLEIKDFDYKGRGFAKKDGKIYFVPGGIIGDSVEVQITEKKSKYSLAKINKIIEKSPDRVKAKCPYFKSCGACDFQNYNYQKQINWKKDKVKQDLFRIGDIDIEVEDTLAMKDPYFYRNNIQLKVVNGKIGYYEKTSDKLVEIDKCLVAENEINKTIAFLKTYKELKSLDEIVIRQNYLGEILVVLIGKSKLKYAADLIDQPKNLKIKSIYQNIRQNPKFRFGKEFIKVYGDDVLIDKLADYEFEISPSSFFQVNRSQTERLYQLAIDNLDLKKEDKVLDLYCGIGTISIAVAKFVNQVVGVEISKQAVENARKNAQRNEISNARFIAGKSEEIIDRLIEEGYKANKIILDPPRAGLDKKLITSLEKLGAEKISYISCNPSSQARDIKLLKKTYKVERVSPVDLFCHSVHVEALALLVKERSDAEK
ncbi:23S rRNA (uracil(1939)-C(5))-methyltransferase RlmD [Peptoniphilus catoniae]|uniref:23S rRNA (uracil(1939)-C(5))-methyltransferase RlmD n=1 Tax=Peptoniphilus catoniae TaxID=1660341 RepID=UPI0010FE8612|nr:23S rRNA (uracil(1939)-C(5))-methyltransferase RlmD [Peptoniphilus catoniae]